jgi:formamidopyrimidine-DNA glycosylase
MTGAVLVDAEPASSTEWEPAHVRVRMLLGGRGRQRRRARLVVDDPRRFGTGELLLGGRALEAFFAARLGLEPFDERFTVAHLQALARGRGAPIKAFLLDQRMVAGVGTSYADEALFRAGIHPRRPAGKLTRAQWQRLREGVIDALEAGIDARGASIDDFRHIDGAKGSFQDRFLVHTRAGEACGVCGTTIEKLVVAGRGTYVCRACQRPPRLRPPRARPAARSRRPPAPR